MFERISLKLRGLLSRADGQAVTEYALVIGFVVVGLGLSLGGLGAGIDNFFDQIAARLASLP